MTSPEDFFSLKLEQLIGGYFHQDWDLNGGDTQRVLDMVVANSTPDELAADAEALAALMAEEFDEAALEEVLARHGCGYYPPGDDGAQTHAEWLEEIAQRLTAALSDE